MQNPPMSSQNKRRAAGVAALLLLLALAGYAWASPLLAIRAMQVAAQQGDADAFNEHVDYPRLRESLKGQLAAVAGARLGAQVHGGNALARAGAAIGAALGMSIADPLVDALVQPTLVMRVMQEGKLFPRAGDTQPTPADAPAQSGSTGDDHRPRIHWRSERQGLDTFIAYAEPDRATGAATDRPIALVLQRSGLMTWKLTEIRLPSMP